MEQPLLWLLELGSMLGQAFWFSWWDLGKCRVWIIESFSYKEREQFAEKRKKMWFFFPSFRGGSGFARGDNVHGPFSPEHINSNVPSVFFTRKRWSPRKHDNVAWGKNVPAMFYKCRTEHNSILPEVHWEIMQHRELCQYFHKYSLIQAHMNLMDIQVPITRFHKMLAHQLSREFFPQDSGMCLWEFWTILEVRHWC